jgi:hypothetical protein
MGMEFFEALLFVTVMATALVLALVASRRNKK